MDVQQLEVLDLFEKGKQAYLNRDYTACEKIIAQIKDELAKEQQREEDDKLAKEQQREEEDKLAKEQQREEEDKLAKELKDFQNIYYDEEYIKRNNWEQEQDQLVSDEEDLNLPENLGEENNQLDGENGETAEAEENSENAENGEGAEEDEEKTEDPDYEDEEGAEEDEEKTEDPDYEDEDKEEDGEPVVEVRRSSRLNKEPLVEAPRRSSRLNKK